jgi:hypothetical protein
MPGVIKKRAPSAKWVRDPVTGCLRTSFKFSPLPPEIRLKIWQLLAEPRDVYGCVDMSIAKFECGIYKHVLKGIIFNEEHRTPPSPIAHICQEVRDEFYPLLLNGKSQGQTTGLVYLEKHLIETKPRNNEGHMGIHFNHKLDTIVLSNKDHSPYSVALLSPLIALTFSSHVAKFQRLRIDSSIWLQTKKQYGFSEAMAKFTGLQEFGLCITPTLHGPGGSRGHQFDSHDAIEKLDLLLSRKHSGWYLGYGYGYKQFMCVFYPR